MKENIILAILLSVLIHQMPRLSIDVVFAQETDIPVASAGAIKEDINKRIKDAIDKNLKGTEAVLATVDTRLYGYRGTITDLKQDVFTLLTSDNTLQVTISSSSAIIKDNKPLKPELLTLKDNAIIIGNMTSTDIISAKRIVIIKEPNTVTKKTIIAPVIKIKTNSIVINIDGKDQEVQLGKKLKLDLKSITTKNKIFGIIQNSSDTKALPTLLQAKIF